jgi:acyl-CoA synthetase (AMP-forming)/AMP-acid ligase II
MVPRNPSNPDTYTRFLQTFQPYGLKSESFYVAYGLAENTLAVSHGGRNIVSVNKRAIALGKARMTTEVSEIGAATQIVSCGTPLPGLDRKIVDPEKHFALKPGHIGEIWVAGERQVPGLLE